MRYIHDAGASFPGKAGYLDLHMVAQSLVQSAQRLVHEDNRRFVDEASSQCHTLLLAPREFGRKPLEHVGQTDDFPDFATLGLDFPPGPPAHAPRERHVLAYAPVPHHPLPPTTHPPTPPSPPHPPPPP